MTAGLPGEKYASAVYKRHANYWRFLRASYLGGRAWYDQDGTWDRGYVRAFSLTNHTEQANPTNERAYLTRHLREPDVFYSVRFRSSVYWNFVRPLVDGMASAVARNARKMELPTQIAYLGEADGPGVDGKGMDMADFDRTCVVDLIRYGSFTVYVSEPKAPELPVQTPEPEAEETAETEAPENEETSATEPYEPRTLMDKTELGMQPQARLISPIDLLSYEYDADECAYKWAVIRERVPAKPKDPFSNEGEDQDERYRYRRVRPDGWELRAEDGTVLDTGPGHGFVPLYTAIREQHPFEVDPIGVSLIEDLAELAKAVYNKYSWLTEEQRNHCFNQWFLKGPEAITPQSQVLFGSSTFIGGFEDAKLLSPSVEPMAHLEESLQHDTHRRARGMLGLGAESGDSDGVKSGIAIALEGEERAATLAGLAKTFQSGKAQWLKGAAMVAGADPDDVEVRVDRDFSDLGGVARSGQILDAIKGGSFGGKAKAALQVELLSALLPNISPDERKEIEDDIASEVAKQDAAEQAMKDAFMNGEGPKDEDGEDMPPPGNGKGGPPFAGKGA